MAKKFEVTILGVNSAFPCHGRHPSCQIVNYDERLFMIDCGEAAQIQLSKYHIKRSKISHIFISHLHGDHCYGLPGLLTSFSLQGRTSKLNLHGPIGTEELLRGVFKVSEAHLFYELVILEYNTEIENSITLNNSISVTTFPMKHRIPTMGFRFDEKIAEHNLNSEAISKYSMSIEEIKAAKNGQSIVRNNVKIPIAELTMVKNKERSYSYCSDTIYDRSLIPFIKNSTLLYHETTYLDDLEWLAVKRMHSTLGQAIEMAKSANVKQLIVGHYSSRYENVDIFLKHGLPKFEGLMLGEEGRVYQV
jgi:ribonuclease Z